MKLQQFLTKTTFQIGNQSPPCWNSLDIVAYRTSEFQPPLSASPRIDESRDTRESGRGLQKRRSALQWVAPNSNKIRHRIVLKRPET